MSRSGRARGRMHRSVRSRGMRQHNQQQDDRVVFLSREKRIRKYGIDCGDRLEWKSWYNVCTHTHTHTHARAYIHTCVPIISCGYYISILYVYLKFSFSPLYAHMHIHTHTHTHTHTHIHTHTGFQEVTTVNAFS